MSYDINPDIITMTAGQDLSSKQYQFVVLASDGQIDPAGTAGILVDGVLQDKPSAAGRAAGVAIGRVTKVRAGGVITKGDKISTKNDGKAQTAASGHVVLGRALETSGAEDDLIAMLFNPSYALP